MAKILVAHNMKAVRTRLSEMLTNESYVVDITDQADVCKRLVMNNTYDLIIYDSDFTNLDGSLFLNFLSNKNLDSRVVMMLGKTSDLDCMVHYLKNGVENVIPHPLDLNRFMAVVRSSIQNIKEKKCVSMPKRRREVPEYEMCGESAHIQAIKRTISKVSNCDARVLITGPNGTGKELVAHCIHASSLRRDASMIEVNCAAIPNDLIESALFGHEKGSFTSADTRYVGRFEQANGGTLFLDEIGDMSLAAQAKVLRALQENKIGRVGGTKEIEVDVRVIAATNKNLKEEIAKGTFREDLYHRLNVIRICVPPLNERKDDIPALVTRFNETFCKRQGITPCAIPRESMEILKNRVWTGNIRELQNVIERLVILCDDQITPENIMQYCND